MAAELRAAAGEDAARERTNPRKRKGKHGKGKKPPGKRSKRSESQPAKSKKPSMKMRKLFEKRAREYHSDSDDEETAAAPEDSDDGGVDESDAGSSGEEGGKMDSGDEIEDGGGSSGEDEEEDEGDGGHRKVTKFVQGCRAFKTAFLKIMKYHLPNDPLGPVLSAHKKLVAEKLAEEEAEIKVKGEAKKEKHLAGEKGHIKPASFLDAKEKYLISVATKGVVKLFNAVNKAQNPRKGLNPSRSKDAKVLAKKRKETFLSELKKPTTEAYGKPSSFNSSKVPRSANAEDDDEPGWAPLRDSYMLTSSKLKDWDKISDPAIADIDRTTMENSSDDE